MYSLYQNCIRSRFKLQWMTSQRQIVWEKNDILLNLQNYKYNLKCCNRATRNDVRSLVFSNLPSMNKYAYMASSIFLYFLLKNISKQTHLRWSTHTMHWNTRSVIVEYIILLGIVYNQDHRSGEWLIRNLEGPLLGGGSERQDEQDTIKREIAQPGRH